jgi:carbonic anhydrase
MGAREAMKAMTIKRLLNIAIASFFFLSLATLGPGQKSEDKATADVAIAELSAGNARHVAHRDQHPTRLRTAAATRFRTDPHAEILSCSDSRVPPELIFDQGLGDLFIVRVAGNVVSDTELGSLEYGAEHLHVPLLVVLGHQHCGALTAAVRGRRSGRPYRCADQPAASGRREDSWVAWRPVENATKANVEMVVKQLRTSTPVLAELVSHGKLKVVGALYSLDTGKVTWLPDTP